MERLRDIVDRLIKDLDVGDLTYTERMILLGEAKGILYVFLGEEVEVELPFK